MSGNDSVVYNVRERPVSDDWNNTQSLAARTTNNIIGFEGLQQSFSYDGVVTDAWIDATLGGLNVLPDGTLGVVVNPGMLVQVDGSLPPTLTVYDSLFRTATLSAPTPVALPAPVSTTYYLIEAQITAVTTSTQSRDILNATTGVFVATPVPKQVEYQVALQATPGVGGAMPTVSTGFVPLAIVKRPAGGGSVAFADIFDIRFRWRGNPNTNEELRRKRGAFEITTNGTEVVKIATLNTLASNDGMEAYYDTDPASSIPSLNTSAYLETGLVLAASTLYHLYLLPWNSNGFATYPRNAQVNTGRTQRGILVVSSTPPVDTTFGTYTANNVIMAPAPWSYTCSNFRALYVGSLRRNAANTGWLPMTRAYGLDAAYGDTESFEPLLGSIPYTPTTVYTTLPLTGFVPPTARTVRLIATVPYCSAGTNMNNYNFRLDFDTSGEFSRIVSFHNAIFNYNDLGPTGVSLITSGTQTIDVPVRMLANNEVKVSFTSFGGTNVDTYPTPGGSATLTVAGWGF